MPAGRTETDVANKALALLGESRTILTLDDNTPRARLLRRHYGPARDEALAAYPWNEATKLATLSATPGVETGGWTAAYLLPGDCMRWLPWDRESDNYFSGEIVGRYLFAGSCSDSSDDGGTILLRYVVQLTQVALWSAGLEAAVAAKLAFASARGITGRSSDQAAMMQLFADELAKAKHQDAQANAKSAGFARQARYHSNWLAARRGRRLR